MTSWLGVRAIRGRLLAAGAAALLLATGACGDEPTTIVYVGSGGSSMGGAGAPNGGANAMGGSNGGSNASGGDSSGGDSNGGDSTGGDASGGSNAGGGSGGSDANGGAAGNVNGGAVNAGGAAGAAGLGGAAGSAGAAGAGGSGGCSNSIEGTVYDPSGNFPLPNAWVYVPQGGLPSLTPGATCLPCQVPMPVTPIAMTTTDAEGKFMLTGLPASANLPLVIQIGKWRRTVTAPTGAACTTTNLSPSLTRLPRSQAEGNIPKIAVTTGQSDALECLFMKLGIASEEFSTDAGTGRIHLYKGGDGSAGNDGAGAVVLSPALGGAALPHATTLWSNVSKMLGYDMLVMSCEGSSFASTKEPHWPNVQAYVDGGGRAFMNHMHFNWLYQSNFQNTATYIGVGDDLVSPSTALVDTSFPEGMLFSRWLQNVGASATLGQIPVYQGQHSVSAVVPPTRQWLYVPNVEPDVNSVQLMTFDTPLGVPAAQQCGKVTFTDMHVIEGPTPPHDNSDPLIPFPDGCVSTISPQIQAMIYMLFESSGCL